MKLLLMQGWEDPGEAAVNARVGRLGEAAVNAGVVGLWRSCC